MKTITIKSKKDGFRRAGMAHSVSPQSYPESRWSPEQLAALKAEPMLLVTEEEVAGGNTGPAGQAAIDQMKNDLKRKKKEELTEMLKGMPVDIPPDATKDELIALIIAETVKEQK
jgi:hypothetical protein